MEAELKLFLAQYVKLPDDHMQQIVDCFTERKLKKNDYLLREGQVCKDFVFVQTGCLRMYYFSEETEVSVWFAFGGSSAIEISSFISETPSEYSIQAINDSVVFCLNKTALNKLYITYPETQEMIRRFWEDVVLNLLKRFTALQKESAETRYANLLNNGDYLQKIPQKYLASFIGITPTSLSRIRRKIK